MFDTYPDVLTVEQLCTALHIGKNSAYKLLNNEEIKSVRIGKNHKIPKLWLIDYFNLAEKRLYCNSNIGCLSLEGSV